MSEVDRPCPNCGHTLNGCSGLRSYGTYQTHDTAYCLRYLCDDREALRAQLAAAAMQPSVADDKSPDWEGFGRAMVEDWPTNDIDGADLFELAAQYRLIAEVAGGYDPETHIDADCICPERGDPWYEYNFRAISKETDNA